MVSIGRCSMVEARDGYERRPLYRGGRSYRISVSSLIRVVSYPCRISVSIRGWFGEVAPLFAKPLTFFLTAESSGFYGADRGVRGLIWWPGRKLFPPEMRNISNKYAIFVSCV